MNNKIQIITYLLENRTKEVNINNLSKETGIDYKNTYNIIKELEKEGIIKIEMFGKSARIKLTTQLHPSIFQAEYERRKELLKNKNLAVMKDYFKSIGTTMYTLLLFGSYAKGTSTKHSDIDLLFIIPDGVEEEMERKIGRVAETIPLKIHINVFKEKDFIAMRKSKEITVGSEATAHNIILHGIEQYYEMIS